MATKLFLRSTQTNGIGATYFDMVVAAGAGSTTAVVDTDGSTEKQWTQTSGGTLIQWISGRAPVGGFTLTTTDISIWAHESATAANAGGRYRVFIRTAAGVETEIGGGPFDDGVEFAKTTPTEMLWTGNTTDQAFAENDRILLKLYITNVGVMGSRQTCTLTYNAADAATGDSFFNIAETVTFKAEDSTPAKPSPVDWIVPKRPRWTPTETFNRAIATVSTIVQRLPFVSRLPKASWIPRQDVSVNLLTTTLAVAISAPFIPADFPPPRQAPRVVQVEQPQNLLTTTLSVTPQAPFTPYDFGYIRPAPRTPQSELHNFTINLPVLAPFIITWGESPKVVHVTHPDLILNLLTNTLGGVAQDPFTPYDFGYTQRATGVSVSLEGPILNFLPLQEVGPTPEPGGGGKIDWLKKKKKKGKALQYSDLEAREAYENELQVAATRLALKSVPVMEVEDTEFEDDEALIKALTVVILQ